VRRDDDKDIVYEIMCSRMYCLKTAYISVLGCIGEGRTGIILHFHLPVSVPATSALHIIF